MSNPAAPAVEPSSAPDVEAPLTLEHVDLELLGLDPAAVTATSLMSWCVLTLRDAVARPGGVRLVITGDFVRSVRERSVTTHQQQNYHVARNAGLVGAKTMPRPNGTIDVLIPAVLFAPDPDPVVIDGRDALVRRTIAHESGHVAIKQAGEASAGYDDSDWVRLNMLSVADTVIEEYRAELAVPTRLREAADSEWDPLTIVHHLRDALNRIAAVDYQSHLDIDKLNYDIGQECLHSWQLLAYIAAARRLDTEPEASMPDEVTSDPIWQWMVHPHWDRFIEILTQVPAASTRTTRTALEPQIHALADELHPWLETLGFRWRPVADAGYEFRIVHWQFMD